MALKHYELFHDVTFSEYSFYSEGPNGRIAKVVRLTPMEGQLAIFNLAFGDLDPSTGQLNDLAITNNGDREKVLLTVAQAVVEFCASKPHCLVYARGSTPARTRLYQMGISRLWPTISSEFSFYGLLDDRWYDFIPNKFNYEALMLGKK